MYYPLSPQSMGELLVMLENNRWIERTPDPNNARIRRTKLTTEGQRALRRGGAEVVKVEARLVAGFSPEEQRRLQSLLERCAAALGEEASR
jgi:DNA-binding MarR family transcriptional regulator